MARNVVNFPDVVKAGPMRRLVPSRLRDARLAQGLNQTELANAISISRQAISAFESGEKGPETDTMARIAEVLQQPLSFFVGEDAAVFGECSPRFFRAFGSDTKKRNLMCDVLGKWFVQTARYLYDLVTFPDVNIPYASPSNGNCYSEDEIEQAAEECRRDWGLGVGPISNVVGLLETNGIAVCRYEVAGQKIEAFSFWSGTKPFIFLASEKDSAVRSRYDAAHELGHLILHKWIGPEELEDPKRLKIIEAEANRFAGALLLPRKSFPNEVYTSRLDAFVELKRRWKVAIQAMVYRCKDLGIFDEVQITNLYKQMSFRKWRTKEPLDDQIPLEQPKLLKRAAEALMEAGKKLGDEIVADIRIAAPVVASFCGLSVEHFVNDRIGEFVPILR
jgi:Zn-dependent peptidase ImmA (M78 family)/transcriptional regulator with XRE-family HTH domain